MKATIYFNNACSTCQKTMALLEPKNLDLTIVTYLTDPPTAETIASIAGKLDGGPEQLIRKKHDAWSDDLDVDTSDVTAVSNWLAENIEALQRPIVVLCDKAVVSRPPERVLELFGEN